MFNSANNAYFGPYMKDQELTPEWYGLIISGMKDTVAAQHLHMFKDDLMNEWPKLISGRSFDK